MLYLKPKILTKLKKKERLELKILTNLEKNLVKASYNKKTFPFKRNVLP